MKKIYCIIVTYNGMQWIKNCLDSLRDNFYPLHIIIVDNGSTDSTRAFVAEKYPWVLFIETGKNLGFGQANNLGIKKAIHEQADYIFLLNQDAMVEPSTISQLVQQMVRDQNIGILSPLHFNGDGSALDNNFLTYLTQSNIRTFLFQTISQFRSDDTLIPTKFVNAAAWLISRDCILKTGGFDPIFFHYGEDRNYCQRALFLGFDIAIDPKARIYHDRSNRKPETKTVHSVVNEDWVHFLSTACDISHQHFYWLVSKRLCRHFALGCINLTTLKLSRFRYHSEMFKTIFNGIPGMLKTRKIYYKRNSIPYLD